MRQWRSSKNKDCGKKNSFPWSALLGLGTSQGRLVKQTLIWLIVPKPSYILNV
jgi:hypothetical protein